MAWTGWIEQKLYVDGDSELCRKLTGLFRSSVLNEAIATVTYEGDTDEEQNLRAEILKAVSFDEVWTEDFEKLIIGEVLGRVIPELLGQKSKLDLNTLRDDVWRDAREFISQRLREVLRHRQEQQL